MIYTSYFAKIKKLPVYLEPVGICRQLPRGVDIRNIIELAPTWDMIKMAKAGDIEGYCRRYKEEILGKLNPLEIYHQIGDFAVLMCYEKPEDFCHRHLVTEWLNQSLRLNIKEFTA